MWVVEDGLPTTENVGDLWYVSARRGGTNVRAEQRQSLINKSSTDSTQRRVHNPENFDLVPPCGANLRSTELAPGASIAMVRTHHAHAPRASHTRAC